MVAPPERGLRPFPRQTKKRHGVRKDAGAAHPARRIRSEAGKSGCNRCVPESASHPSGRARRLRRAINADWSGRTGAAYPHADGAFPLRGFHPVQKRTKYFLRTFKYCERHMVLVDPDLKYALNSERQMISEEGTLDIRRFRRVRLMHLVFDCNPMMVDKDEMKRREEQLFVFRFENSKPRKDT